VLSTRQADKVQLLSSAGMTGLLGTVSSRRLYAVLHSLGCWLAVSSPAHFPAGVTGPQDIMAQAGDDMPLEALLLVSLLVSQEDSKLLQA
jgi:hypothetical protein